MSLLQLYGKILMPSGKHVNIHCKKSLLQGSNEEAKLKEQPNDLAN